MHTLYSTEKIGGLPAPFEEYNAGTRVWDNCPLGMILKVAKSMALKQAFTVSELVSREEMDAIQEKEDYFNKDIFIRTEINKSDDNSSNVSELTIREKEIKEIVELVA